MVGTNDLNSAGDFYDAVLSQIGLSKITSVENRYIGYGHSKNSDDVKFYVTNPHNKKQATIGNGTMIALSAETKEAVDKFHAIALEKGATSEGAPGKRSDGNYYGYVRDLDGNKIAANVNKLRPGIAPNTNPPTKPPINTAIPIGSVNNDVVPIKKSFIFKGHLNYWKRAKNSPFKEWKNPAP